MPPANIKFFLSPCNPDSTLLGTLKKNHKLTPLKDITIIPGFPLYYSFYQYEIKNSKFLNLYSKSFLAVVFLKKR